jgi:hypothetical protein
MIRRENFFLLSEKTYVKVRRVTSANRDIHERRAPNVRQHIQIRRGDDLLGHRRRRPAQLAVGVAGQLLVLENDVVQIVLLQQRGRARLIAHLQLNE